jgi:hypothetical protein
MAVRMLVADTPKGGGGLVVEVDGEEFGPAIAGSGIWGDG